LGVCNGFFISVGFAVQSSHNLFGVISRTPVLFKIPLSSQTQSVALPVSFRKPQGLIAGFCIFGDLIMDTTKKALKSGIYQILNIENNNRYVGSSKDLDSRLYTHKRQLQEGKHSNYILQAAWDEFGEDSFEFSILEYCEINELADREQSYLPVEKTSKALRQNGFYNISPSAVNTAGMERKPRAKPQDNYRGPLSGKLYQDFRPVKRHPSGLIIEPTDYDDW
jgi:hypothetical protein